MKRGRRKRTAILISGRGTNMSALIHAALDPSYPAEIVSVISNKEDAGGLKIAENHSVPAAVISEADFANREEHDAAIDAALRNLKVEIVCLAGYLRLLSDRFVKKWQGRMINIHPSLLPSFKGLHTHKRALSSGILIHGCSVHFVTSSMDEGPIIAQVAVPVLVNDTEGSLAERVLEAEHDLYPQALAMVASGQVRMSSGRTVFKGNEITDSRQRVTSPHFESTPARAEDKNSAPD